MKKTIFYIAFCTALVQCTSLNLDKKVQPAVITEQVNFDTDDPAIWINPQDASQSLIIGTDKETEGGLFVFDLNGKIVNKVPGLKRPNNVDVEYGFNFQGKKIDIAVTTERQQNKIRIYEVPSMEEIGAISVFEGETDRDPMGISIYKNPHTEEIFAIVGRKFGPSGTYLWQYKLSENNGKVAGEVVRKFGNFSGKKEIESIAVDDELGFIYYSDEGFGVRKYYADPAKGNQELALFGQKDFKEDVEGISIYDTGNGKGYILISNQQADTFNVYRREGNNGNANQHYRIAEIPVSTKESDGSEVVNVNLGPKFPNGVFVAMTNGKVFHYYDWREFQKIIDEQSQSK
ncbi:phytase [Chryseobacterium sp. VAUSW3]|uniref:phytase n=1 Tax=Chryseobacterium sp. VAUSW3 TaxID=2010998 RepID=UPI000B4C2BDE|nr:phytase [Chryseobacterium sp. VAUSW3]OWR15086.1 3-phytase [Chryseobacterium sp. VAUSW3]